MEQWVTEAPQFDILKKQYEDWASTGFQDGDVGFISTLQEINKIEGITTVWCCVGHKATGSYPYIVLAVKRGYSNVASEFLNEIQSVYEQHNRRLYPMFGFRKNNMPTDNKDGHYWMWTVRSIVQNDRGFLVRALETAAKCVQVKQAQTTTSVY